MIVEVYEKGDFPTMEVDLSYVPRIGEYLAIETDYFVYFNVVEVWQRKARSETQFRACIRVERED